MDSKQGRFSVLHLTTLVVVGGLVGMLTISCGSTGDQPPVDEPEAGTPEAAPPQEDGGQVGPDTGAFIDAGPCIPQDPDCTGKCGPLRDPCSGIVKMCGGCATGEVCDLKVHTCGVPKTKCADFGAECGQVQTSCGKYISCGSCAAGQECNPDTNKCQAAAPVTCQDLGYECGAAWLGSGDPSVKTNCGTCKDPNKNRCNTAFNICEPSCTPPAGAAAKQAFCDAARQSKGIECGVISDGCGGTVDCSLSKGFNCPAGQGCGVRGVANRCEPFPTPPECEALGKNCGTIPSSCGGTVTCGVCEQPAKLPDGGTPPPVVCDDNNICGPACKSQTCAQALPVGTQCGAVSDGCKGTLNCACPNGGKCTAQKTCCAPKTCGQLVGAGQCGKQLDDGCGGKVDCNCGSGRTCNGAGNTPVSNGQIGSCCQRKTCAADYPGQCGAQLDDGCGGTLNCNCGGGQSCIVGGPPGTPTTPGQVGSCCNETNCPAGACNTTVASVCVSGQTLTCNNCPAGQVCNGVTCCAPVGCGNQCGVTIDQGCGLGQITCGCNLPSTCNGGVCTCPAPTLADCPASPFCGTVSNACGSVNCGCPGGQVCNNNTCCAPIDQATACAASPGACVVSNGCGGTYSCCAGGQVCNNNSCCSPVDKNTACAGAGGKCTASDGCGGSHSCCPSNQSCFNNTCCSPLTCNAPVYAGKCGNFTNGCGGTLNCGCTGVNTCGGGGTAGQCGCTPKKAPQDCAGQVGLVDDGCGGKITCSG